MYCVKGESEKTLKLDGDSTERTFYRDFSDVKHQNDLGIG